MGSHPGARMELRSACGRSSLVSRTGPVRSYETRSAASARTRLAGSHPETVRAYLRHVSRGARIRTGDLLLPKQARYRAAPRPVRLQVATVAELPGGLPPVAVGATNFALRQPTFNVRPESTGPGTRSRVRFTLHSPQAPRLMRTYRISPILLALSFGSMVPLEAQTPSGAPGNDGLRGGFTSCVAVGIRVLPSRGAFNFGFEPIALVTLPLPDATAEGNPGSGVAAEFGLLRFGWRF